MAVKGFYDNPQEATIPADSNLLAIQTGTTLADMKKITYENLVKPLDGRLDTLEADIQELAGAGRTIETVKQNADDIALAGDRIDNIIASSGTSDTEVVDARLSGSTGVLYTLLKNRLDAMEKQMMVTNESDVPIATIKFRMSGNQPQLVTEAL